MRAVIRAMALTLRIRRRRSASAAARLDTAGSGARVRWQDVLTTRKLTVANLEARVPLVRAFGRLSRANALPVDALVFADAGALWTRERASASPPTILRSAGAGIRLNAGGFVFEVDAARVLDAAPRGWRLSFNFLPRF